jgi:hypothetical protein
MKKSIFLATFGLSMTVASSYGDGYVEFSSYAANGGIGATTSFFGGSLVPASYMASLYYHIGAVSDPVNNNSVLSIISAPTGLTPLGNSTSFYLGTGTFDGPVVTIPGYVSGPITFEVVAYNDSDFNDSMSRGRSGSFTMNSIATGPLPIPDLGDNGQPMPNFFVYPSPEPTTLALAGFGGLVSLAVFRRKQSNIEC